jgi:hypothetical protein
VREDELRPTAGARFLLERVTDSGDRATYRAVIFTPDAEFSSSAELREDGTFDLPSTGASTELHDDLAMQVRLLARGATKRREDGLPAWPNRVLRWRGPGRGA